MKNTFRTFLFAAIAGSLLIGATGSFLYFYFNSKSSVAAPVSQEPPSSGIAETRHGNLTIYRDPAEAFAQARKTGRPVFLDFYADWCVNCVKFQDRMLQDDALNQALSESIVLKVVEDDAAFQHYSLEGRLPEINESLPLFAVLSPANDLVWKGQDYLDSQSMIEALNRAIQAPRP